MSTIYTPTVGVVYKFTFQNGYNVFDGTYRLAKLMEYDEYLNDGGDLLTDFYEPNGKTETELNADLNIIKASKIMKLVDPDALISSANSTTSTTNAAQAVFAPLCLLLSSPDYNVKKYNNLGVIAHMGITDSSTDYTFMLDRVTEAVEATLGVTPAPKLVILGHKWLTDEEYAEIVAERDESKKSLTNYYSENVKLQKQVQSQERVRKINHRSHQET